ncbi:transcription factor bHLH168-like [Phragmites australis]|uniref:transcription factor bHLH168-like n=1 Tax=Phragmites australis TaxID=29695 RepID=UPI002D796708|nr:transcription factor bHLH168-like [Phragmites australis]XP_062191443.1 transcription factor bHLH168-like [Phragmites australis]
MEMKATQSGGDIAGAAGRRSSTRTMAVERKEIESKRRQHMRSLCFKLASLIPEEHHSKGTMTQLGSLHEAAAYIKKLKERVDELQRKRSAAQHLTGMRGGGGGGDSTSAAAAATTSSGAGSEEGDDEALAAPVVEVRDHHDGSSLDLVLISSMERPFKLHEVITVLEEEGAEIINANLSVAGRKIFYTIHSRAFSSRIGIEVSRVSERLGALV